MDARQVALCLIHSAIKWPNRLSDITQILPEVPIPDPLYATTWRAIQRAASQGGVADSTNFRERVTHQVTYEQPSLESTVSDWIHRILYQAEPNEACCMDILRRYALEQLAYQVSPDSSTDDVDLLMSKATQINALASGRTLKPVDLFGNDGEDLLEVVETPPINFFLMDGPFGGLFPRGRMLMYVMPTKGGKTLHALQLSKHLVDAGMSVLYLNFEQVARGDLAARIYAQISGTSIRAWENIDRFSDAPVAQRRALERNQAAWDQRFKFLSADELAADDSMPDGVESLRRLVDDLYIKQGQPPPDLIILDWWRELWLRYVATLEARGRVMHGSEARQKEITEFKKAKLMAQSMNTRVLVYVQMRGAISESAFDMDRLTMADAAENKSLIQVADAGMISTTKDPETSIVTHKLALCRFGANGWKGRAVMDGPHGRFVPDELENGMESQFGAVFPAAPGDPGL